MRGRLLLLVLLGSVSATGCLYKNRQRGYLNDKPPAALPSALAKGQPPKPPTPAASDPANTLPDETEYKAVAIPAPPQPISAVVPASAQIPVTDGESSEDEKKRLLERIRERREERRDERNKEAKPPAPAKPEGKGAEPDGVAAAKKLYQMAAAKYEKLTDASALMVRREVVGGKESATEEIEFQFRKQPFSVYMKNVGEAGKGREVLYVDGKFDGKMHVVTGKGDNLIMGAGFKISLSPDSSMATSRSRHKITEAGPGQALARIERHVKAAEAGKRTIKSLGSVQRKDQPNAVEGIEITVPPGDDPLLPKGGKWTLYFDTKADSPGYGHVAVHVMTDEKDREVEYYCFTKWKVPANLTDADFNPDRLGKRK